STRCRQCRPCRPRPPRAPRRAAKACGCCRLAEQASLAATFVESDVYALDDHALGEFDIVHTSYDVLPWLLHLDRWAEIVAAHLAPGGLLHWPHGIGEVATALLRARLRIEWLRELPRTPYPFPKFLKARGRL